MKIRIRGNTSAVDSGDTPPYKLRLAQPADLLGLGEEYTESDWVLLPHQNLNPWIGQALADCCGLEWVLKCQYVNFELNGDYKGIYMLSEGVNFSSSHGLIHSDGYVFERDAYWWNEPISFNTSFF